jgi:hypothetical protein
MNPISQVIDVAGRGSVSLSFELPNGQNRNFVAEAMNSSNVVLYRGEIFANLDGTPLAETPINHKGPLNVDWLTGYLVWAIAWFFVFSPVFTTQGGLLAHGASLGWPLRRRFSHTY